MRIATEMKYSHFRNPTPRAALLLLRQSRIMFIVCVTAPGIALLLRVGRGNNFPMLPSRFLVDCCSRRGWVKLACLLFHKTSPRLRFEHEKNTKVIVVSYLGVRMGAETDPLSPESVTNHRPQMCRGQRDGAPRVTRLVTSVTWHALDQVRVLWRIAAPVDLDQVWVTQTWL